MDAIALVQRFGKPDLFIIMTCNPTWPEIKEHLWTTDETQNRPDLISRVFRAKIEELKTDISKRNIFGKIVVFIAELPDANLDKKLRSLVLKYMMHDPCGNLNPTDSCIKRMVFYQSARWVSPPEAAWRLFGFSISEMYPSVYHLQLHLKGQQFMNRSNKDAIKLNLLYKEFPEHFEWSTTDKTWTRRQQRCAVGRIITCHPTEGERYYIRLLLLNVRGPKSYKDLRTINGEHYNSFRESAQKRGLLHYDNSLIDCMLEAASYQMPFCLRRLFATLLTYCNPANPKEIWKQFEESLSEDYRVLPNVERKDIQYQVLNQINDVLHYTLWVIICNISKQSSTAGLIRDAKLIVWDEVSMAKKRMLDVFDLLLKDLMDTNILFGGKVVVFGGDFRQTLPVVRNGKKEDFISKSLLYSTIWDELEKLQLSENMRAKTDPAFCDYLMRIENGQERVNTNNKLELPDSIIIPFTTEEESLNHLFTLTFSNVHTCSSNPFLQILALF
ncbi:uncharacterized protein [Nicotiana sylvestris]|uniref:uncharacterized protein n=1 Tax=Nicotiana sylvestris TaxID=4096 RepID=UPI00388C5728